jgi:NTP pyrophosphatase (non-canonical NTP hydrolase)
VHLSDYQLRAQAFVAYPAEYAVIYPTLGLVGEAGEVADLVKKSIRDDSGTYTKVRHELIMKELGDTLWYLAAVARDMGWSLDAVASLNIEKLQDRANRGVLGGSGDTR